jgi:fibronectin-binding autotransporter adhesin
MRFGCTQVGGKFQGRMKRTSTRAIIAAAATAACAGVAHGQTNVPIAVSNWNADVVADSAPIASSTNYEFDAANTPYGGGVYYSASYNTTGGIPLTTFVSATNSNTTFYVADTSPSANEAFMLNAVVPTGASGGNGTGGLSGEPFYTSGTVNLSSPASYTNLALLSAVSNGQAGKNLTVDVQLNFVGGVIDPGLSFAGRDWTASGPYAVTADNINRGTTGTAISAGNPGGLLEDDIAIPQAYQSLLLQSITFTMADTATGNDWTWGLLGVSGSVGSTGNFLWSGNISTPSNPSTATWDNNVTPNFTGSVFNGSGSALFADYDGNNNQVVTGNVQVSSGGVTPFNTTFNNSSISYNVTGGAISGSGGLIQEGSGTTTIYNTNNYSGGTAVTAGTLIFANGSSVTSPLGTTSFTVGNSGTLTFMAGSEQVTGNVSIVDNGTVNLNNPTRVLSSLTGTGILNLYGTALAISSGGYTGTINQTGSVTINASMNFGGIGIFNTYSGGTLINGSSGTQVAVTVGSNGAFGTGPVVFNNAALQTTTATASQLTVVAGNPIGNNYSFGSVATLSFPGAVPIDLAGNGTLGTGPTTISIGTATATTVLAGTLSDSLSGPSMLIKTGPGTLTLSGSNSTYSGGTNASTGTLILAGTNPFGGATYVASGATLQLNTSGGLGTSTTSSVNIASGGTMIVNDNSGSAGLAGSTPIPTTIAGVGIVGADTYGALRGIDGQSAAYAGNIVIAPGGASISGGVTGTLTISGAISNSPASTNPALDTVVFSRANSSTTVLTGNSTYTGETEMIPNININGVGQSVSVLQIGANNAINPSSGFNQVNITTNYDGLTLDLHGYNQSFAYITGGFHVNSGSTFSNYLITNNGNTPSVLTINNGNATVAGTGYMATPGPQVYADNIQDGSNTITLVKAGPGTEILTGTNSYSGGTTVTGGTLQASSPSALGTSGQGTITLGGGTLFLAASQTNVVVPIVNGFKGFSLNEGGTGSTRSAPSLNNTSSGTTTAYSVATLTTRGTYADINSAFSPLKTISTAIGFTASFTYTDTNPSTSTIGSPGGVAFVIQSAGQSAVGTGTSYGGSSGITSSFNVSLYDPTPTTSATAVDGGNATTVTTQVGNFNNMAPVNVSLTYTASNQTLSETLSSSTGTITETTSGINLTSLLKGGTGYIGFTGSTVGSAASQTQQITNFTFGSYSNGPIALQNPFVTVQGTSSTLMSTVATGVNTQDIGTLTIAPASTLHLAASSQTGTTRMVLYPQSLTYNTAPGVSLGTLDIVSNDLDLPNTSIAAVTALVASGYNLTGGARWNGPGITSSAAAADTSHLTAVGVILNTANGNQIYGQGAPLGSFDGDNPPSSGDILVKYTYFGDANLDGKVDGSDYSLIDAGYASQKTGTKLSGWYNGDFNYDGTVDGSDYALIDNAFNNQGAPAVSQALTASSTAQVAGPTAVPEPASLGILAVAAGLGSRRRRSR